jgi:antitoxin VapB
MALSIKTDEADALARALAAETNESLTQAVTTALRERLDRVRGVQQPSMQDRLAVLSASYAAAQVVDPRTPEEIIGYDAAGAPA